ncbi:MAG: 16S rRNA (guanine(966)-N(2))-methyltransferase RsmD [Coprobacillus sp.]|nr:16S rRNA (guanine(966)-N(2))-methyltransferase RsmD [Coprobacillus sp.]
MPKKVESLRIISGTLRHRRILFPTNGTRPTKDKVKEALFSSLGNINDKVFLDLYAGSGQMGLEALSRGATLSYFVDNNPECISVIKKNIDSLDLNECSCVLRTNDRTALENLSQEGVKFDIIYIDPPYEEEHYSEILDDISRLSLLNNNGIIIIESNHPLEESDYPNYFITKRKNFGFINLTYLTRKEETL